MNHYPPLAHYLAAWLSPIWDSGLVSMFNLGMASLFVVYVALFSMGALVSKSAAIVAVCILAGLALLDWPIHGFELRGNYFYSQAVATALAYCAFLAAMASQSHLRRDALFLAATITIGFAHMIAALQLIAAYGVLLCFEGVTSKSGRWRVGYWAIASLGFLAFHPSVRAMLDIGTHEGGLDLLAVDQPVMQAVLVAATGLIGAGCALMGARRNDPTIVAIGCLIFASFALSASLWGAHTVAGLGSYYGFKKTLFSLTTLAPFGLCILLVRDIHIKGATVPIIASAGSVAVLFAVLIGSSPIDATRLEVLREAVEHSGYQAESNRRENSATIVNFPELTPIFNYLLTIGELHVPRDERAAAVYTNDFTGVQRIDAVLTDRMEQCSSEPVGPIFRVPFDCWVANR
ncbi:hypothetical protein [Aliihoeflea sp. 40Bstr573]|uniref:hypothetical protein n=1 Tax=Aliihoeflea sp. 40Bstr573 TaxID=2696467 RepID=UPI002094915B|nr:hypothetical protein [Aliihoeflea sp. 40Bstr573]MCO6386343.1 hypothetical protein [Aliihoeflea sp. 40Bstr573]